MKKVYVLTLNAVVHSGLSRILNELGGSVITAKEGCSPPANVREDGAELVAVLFSNDKSLFKSKHLRCLPSLELAEKKGFEVHNALSSFLSGHNASVLILYLPNPSVPTTVHAPQREALRHFHHRSTVDGRWHGPKAKSASKKGRMTLRRAERHAERRAEFGFVHSPV